MEFCMCVVALGIFLSFTDAKLPGMLYPRDSESRSVKRLDGMWNFRADKSSNRNSGFENKWFTAPLDQSGEVIPMPVPSSFNDVTQDKSLRDFTGWVWYDRQFYADQTWMSRRVILRLDSAHYFAIVWVNGQELMQHVGGHLPFENEVTKLLDYSGVNRITVAVNNTLTPTTLPPGSIHFGHDRNRYPEGYFVQDLNFDFFNYAGIHRHVSLYTIPTFYIEDITIVTGISGTSGVVNYTVSVSGQGSLAGIVVTVLNKKSQVVGTSSQAKGTILVPNAHFWWPYTMNQQDPAYLYTLKVAVYSNDGSSADVYRQPFGIRTVAVTNTQFLINSKPFYCQGLGKHEDSDLRGKGLDYVLIAKDFNMLKWLGVNCFRTSHYPYAEEIMDQANQQGIVVIDESPGVGITQSANFGNTSLAHHLEVMGEMYQRDKNRPAVIMWSVANEPSSQLSVAKDYFHTVINHTRQLDPTRPVTFVSNKDFYNDLVAQYVDVVCVNRYYAWYSDMGHTELIQRQLTYDLQAWHKNFNKPVIVTEYGSETVVGLHQEPSWAFSEEYQVDFMKEYHKVFDHMKQEFLVGEMIWNFADFMVVQGVSRVIGNRKGMLTRQRQPKMSGHLLRERYFSLMNNTVNHCT